MNVDLADGCCRACGGQLKIIGFDDSTLTVECECGDSYDVETDAFGDGCVKYLFALQLQGHPAGEGDDGPDRRPA